MRHPLYGLLTIRDKCSKFIPSQGTLVMDVTFPRLLMCILINCTHRSTKTSHKETPMAEKSMPLQYNFVSLSMKWNFTISGIGVIRCAVLGATLSAQK